MDFNSILDKYICAACIMSVEVFDDGKYGNIRIAAANSAHKELQKRLKGIEYSENIPYEECLPRSLNFEDYCYRSAVLHEPHHSYIEIADFERWLEMYFLPIESDSESIKYCIYVYEAKPIADIDVMTDVPPNVSSRVLAACIKLHGAQNFNECIEEVVKDIRNICGARRCSIIVVDEEARESSVLADSMRTGYAARRTTESMNKGFYSTAEGWKETLAGNNSLIVKNEQDMLLIKERNPIWYDALKRNGVETVILFQLRFDDRLVGYIWATNFDVANAIMIKGVMELTSFFLASRIANYQIMTRLEMMSTMDILTGTKNRNAMNNRVDEFDDPACIFPKSIGVIFADLNGLKKTNDSMGHASGDRLLKKAAAILTQVFIDEDIYRAGGDEFVILSMSCTLEYLENKLAELRKICDADQDVSFAIGYSFQEGKFDIRECLRRADSKMYEDKEEYYKNHPERRYR